MSCLLIDCVLPFDRLYSAFYWIGMEAGERYIEGRRKAGYLFQVTGQRQERIYFGLNEMCSAFYWDCVLPFIELGGRQDISPKWQERDTLKAGENLCWVG